jgi:hypothetical protein
LKPQLDSFEEEDFGLKPQLSSFEEEDFGLKPQLNSFKEEDFGLKPRQNLKKNSNAVDPKILDPELRGFAKKPAQHL